MSLVHLSQIEADRLIGLEKMRVDTKIWLFPKPGDIVHVPLSSTDKKESFILDVRRGRIALKATYQERAFVVVPLIRVDIGGPPHRNPDDVEVPSPHIHIYREGYGDKWAHPLPAGEFRDPSDLWETLLDFMAYCKIVDTPDFQKSLF
jgi:hypothetical protein